MPGFIYPNQGAAVLANLVRTALVAAELRLFKSDTPETPSTVLADLDECDFDGYAAVDPVVWGAVFLDPLSTGGSFQVSKQWTWGPAGAPPVGNVVYGWYLTTATAADLLCYGRFPGPISMSMLLQAINMTLKLNYGANVVGPPVVTVG